MKYFSHINADSIVICSHATAGFAQNASSNSDLIDAYQNQHCLRSTNYFTTKNAKLIMRISMST